MLRLSGSFAVIVVVFVGGFAARAQDVFLRGRVVMEGGGAPGRTVGIEKVCAGLPNTLETITNKKGEYVWRTEPDRLGRLNSGVQIRGTRVETVCRLRASLSGYVSSSIDLMDPALAGVLQLPPLVLKPKVKAQQQEPEQTPAPAGANKAWERATKAMEARQWAEAESSLREAIAAAPKFATGWNALGVALQNQAEPAEARTAFNKAIEIDPALLASYALLTRLEIDSQNWEAASRAASTLIERDKGKRHLDAYLQKATARFRLNDLAGSESSLNELIAQDRAHQYPRAEYLLGLILDMKGDKSGAAEHMRKYLELEPASRDAAQVRQRMENLGRPNPGEIALALEKPEPERVVLGEARVPGGIRALSAMARLVSPAGYASFFGEYCKEIARQTSGWNQNRTLGYVASLEGYMTAVERLEQAGQRRGDHTVVTLSLATEPSRLEAERVLPLLGWKVVRRDGKLRVELGSALEDSFHQPIAAALGIDEIAMQETLEVGKPFELQVPSENAALFGGAAWSSLLRDPAPAGGIAGAFARDSRLARACAGLAGLPPETATAVVAGAGMAGAVTRYSTALAIYAGAFRTVDGRVVVPGGKPAEDTWTQLVGVNPDNPPGFFRAALEKDGGRLATFYHALSQADAEHQRYFTRDVSRAQQYYVWYRDSEELKWGIDRPVGVWRPRLFQELPLDGAGNVRFPGGRNAWSSKPGSDDDVILTMSVAEMLVPLARIEGKRARRLDEPSVKLLIEHYDDWLPLFSYFERWPALGQEEFGALAAVSKTAAALAPPARHTLLGHLYAVLEILSLGSDAGSLDSAAVAREFERTCELLRAGVTSQGTLEALRAIAGNGDLDSAVVGKVLRLDGDRKSAFDQIREMQQTPKLASLNASSSAASVLEALTGLVYAARLSPEFLLISEDARLANRHQFIPETAQKKSGLFATTSLVRSTRTSGARFAGGFMNLTDAARELTSRGAGAGVVRHEAAANGAAPHRAGNEAPVSGPTFRVSGRLVEVPVTVTDSRGRYVDGLPRAQFNLLEDGKMRSIDGFEALSQSVSCALLFDATGSMQAVLPSLKNAAINLIAELRPEDSMAVYAFNDRVFELQPFTQDKAAAKRAVVHTQPTGETALYDALVRVNQDLTARSGKKVIVVFTDGVDNKSTLTSEIAARVAKAYGIPIYAVAQGDAAADPGLVKQLMRVSKATGGLSFNIHNSSQIRDVFEEISRDLRHGYMLTFRPQLAEDRAWHEIQVVLQKPNGRKVRAREGYFRD